MTKKRKINRSFAENACQKQVSTREELDRLSVLMTMKEELEKPEIDLHFNF